VERAAEKFSFRHVRLDYPYFLDMDWVSEVAKQTQRELLHDHQVVLYADADEIVWHTDGLDRYAASFAGDVVTTTGWQVIHTPGEAPLDPARPVLSQRRYWSRSTQYDKPLLVRVPVNWDRGFHQALRADGPCDAPAVREQGFAAVAQDPALVLFHLHYADLVQARRKNCRNATYPVAEKARHHGWAAQCLLTGDALEEHLRYACSGARVEIPETVRSSAVF
jgi:hypothetical protein